ncbi:MAG: hypothetical protein Ct9H300mP1_32480 [Planctomycetaceae bacterium]|nr:MAG: hypothetical protein Ct9H300mP1_32480 [Planctomycetaceae bacterium]
MAHTSRASVTARVMVNRIWGWHFGEGLVRTPDNFGQLGEEPTHPHLLDHLAGFFRDGWSLKRLHRRIMLSSVTARRASHVIRRRLSMLTTVSCGG